MSYPILAPNTTWYKSEITRSNIVSIYIVDSTESYTATGTELDSWNADVNNTGSIKCYITADYALYIVGNGSGKIALNEDSSYVFSWTSEDETDNLFSNVTFIGGLNTLDASSVTSMKAMFSLCSSLSSSPNQIMTWDTSSVTDFSFMFDRCSALPSTVRLNTLVTSSATTLRRMFQGCTSITKLYTDSWDTSNVTNMEGMFLSNSTWGAMSLSYISTIGSWDVSKVTTMYAMFQYCMSLTNVGTGTWNTSSLTDVTGMFNYCSAMTSASVRRWNVSNVTNMQYMFNKCSSLTTIDVSDWNVSNVTNMQYMFRGCTSLETLNVRDWDVSKVTSMKSMFNCGNNYGVTPMVFTELNVSLWDTSSCTDMSFMFYGCKGPKTIECGRWDVSKVENFDHMFAHSYLVVNGIENWVTTSATNLNAIFHTITNETIDVSNFVTGNVEFFVQMFENATATKIIGLENFDTSNSLGFEQMFQNCKNLKELNLSSFDTRKAKDGVEASTNGHKTATLQNIFNNCYSLEKITLGANFSFNGDGTTTNTDNVAVLPTPSVDYVDEADGNWYTIYGDVYAAADIPTNTAATYYAYNIVACCQRSRMLGWAAGRRIAKQKTWVRGEKIILYGAFEPTTATAQIVDDASNITLTAHEGYWRIGDTVTATYDDEHLVLE